MQSQVTISKAKRSATSKAADAIKVLKSQHRDVEKLFSEFEKSGERAFKTKSKLFEEIAGMLDAHAKIEEDLLYPKAKTVDSDLTMEAYEEHDLVKYLIKKIRATEVSDESFDAKIAVLQEVVRHHVEEEEKDLFPAMRNAFSKEELSELGMELQEEFDAIMAADKKGGQLFEWKLPSPSSLLS